jgi:hypothetical protein
VLVVVEVVLPTFPVFVSSFAPETFLVGCDGHIACKPVGPITADNLKDAGCRRSKKR